MSAGTDEPVLGWTTATFERIGSRATPSHALVVDIPEAFGSDADELTEFLYRHCRKHLTSREFNVSVNLRTGEVAIGGGRLGRGQLSRS